jgi:hypothetical protein
MNLKKLIKERLDKAENRRNYLRRLEESNKVLYNVQYLPCGHSRRIYTDEVTLLEKAREWTMTHSDAYIRPSVECPICRAKIIDDWVENMYD